MLTNVSGCCYSSYVSKKVKDEPRGEKMIENLVANEYQFETVVVGIMLAVIAAWLVGVTIYNFARKGKN